MIDIQYSITIMGGREVSRPYRVLFFAEGERFLCFCFSPPVFFHWTYLLLKYGNKKSLPCGGAICMVDDLEVSGYSALKRAACDAMSSASLK